jgi:hypothetical protein
MSVPGEKRVDDRDKEGTRGVGPCHRMKECAGCVTMIPKGKVLKKGTVNCVDDEGGMIRWNGKSCNKYS